MALRPELWSAGSNYFSRHDAKLGKMRHGRSAWKRHYLMIWMESATNLRVL